MIYGSSKQLDTTEGLEVGLTKMDYTQSENRRFTFWNINHLPLLEQQSNISLALVPGTGGCQKMLIKLMNNRELNITA